MKTYVRILSLDDEDAFKLDGYEKDIVGRVFLVDQECDLGGLPCYGEVPKNEESSPWVYFLSGPNLKYVTCFVTL